jgi:formate hydrogenlyase transcriptional activator
MIEEGGHRGRRGLKMSSDAARVENRSWTYADVSSLPAPDSVEDYMLLALRRLTSTLEVGQVCDAVLSGVEQVAGATSSWIMLHDAAADALRTARFRGRGAEVYRQLEIPVDRGIAGRVFTDRRIQFVADVAAETRWYNAERVRQSGLRSVLLLPLIAGDDTLGVLGLDSPGFAETPPGLTDLKRLEIFAAQAAVGLVNARLYTSSQQDRAKLRELLQERRSLRRQVMELRDEVRDAYSFGPIVGESDAMRAVLAEVEEVARCDVTLLLLGETGTGKELLARAAHERSRRAQRPFVAVNCAALPENLVESEMFGHERGAFTGALSRKPGRFELAHRGTLFLDEIGDLPLNAQAKLLRVLQDGEVQRVGGTQPAKVDVRIIAATHQDLPARVAEGTFRSDLYYRLTVFPIRVPPLRERPGDIPLLARHLLLHRARRLGKRITGITEDALRQLSSYHWPGNVRELQNVIERAVILCRDDVVNECAIRLGEAVTGAIPMSTAVAPPPTSRPDAAPVTLAEAERAVIIRALRHSGGRVSGPAGAAALLGLKPTTLHAKMKKLGVRRDACAP